MSPAQQQASRQNGALSNGPVTPEGKSSAARNSLKHGLTGGPVVLPHESQDQYDALKRSLAQTYRAVSAAERSLIDEMAACRWRLNRIEMMETAILNQAYERILERQPEDADIDPDRIMAMAFADVGENSKGFRNLDRHQRTLWRSYDRALQELLALQEARTNAAQNEPERPADYSSLPPLTGQPKSANFLNAALPYLARQTETAAKAPQGSLTARRVV